MAMTTDKISNALKRRFRSVTNITTATYFMVNMTFAFSLASCRINHYHPLARTRRVCFTTATGCRTTAILINCGG